MKRIVAIIISIILILNVSGLAFAANEAKTPSGIPIKNLEAFVDGYMLQYIGKTTPGSAVVIVKDGKIVFSKGYGYADIEGNIQVDSTRTVFEYGSISKLFVYITIMRLVEQGGIDLNDDIRSYLPENFLKELEYDKPITLLDVMNHTTGFEDYLFDVILVSPTNRPTLEQVLKNAQPAQVYEPGTVSAYSNYAVGLAAYAVEGILGQEFYDYLANTIFKPLNMNSTSAHPTLEDKPELLNRKANGYIPRANGGFKQGGWSYIPLYPVGGINGTAEDLAQFAIALLPEDGQESPLFEERKTLDKMFTQTLSMGPGITGFAHGFMEYDGEHRGVGHGGNTAYFSAQINVVPEDRFGVIILTNAANESYVTSGLTEALIGKTDKSVTVGGGELPDAAIVQGTYISARRMHRGFLEFFNYLSMITVKAVDLNTIKLSLGGHTATMVQTSPYTYERVNATGPVLSYHLSPIYFDVVDGQVQKVSGNFLPLSSGRTIPWIIISLTVVAVSVAYLLVALIVLFVCKLRRKTVVGKTGSFQRLTLLIIFGGVSILANNALIILRMLSNNFRSFSELRPQILLNYPLTVITSVFIILSIVSWKNSELSIKQRVSVITAIVVVTAFIGTLVNWQFFRLIG